MLRPSASLERQEIDNEAFLTSAAAPLSSGKGLAIFDLAGYIQVFISYDVLAGPFTA